MTERLDYFDPYLRACEAQVVEMVTHEGRPAAVLNRSCFYPTSGGQLHDTGTLRVARSAPVAAADRVDVVDVVAVNDTLLHILATEPAFAPGTPVVGVIDWARRYDHMQQHSGQHLLSQLLYQRFGLETVAVHFGRELSTLDLDADTVTPAQLEEAEQAANELLYYNLDILSYFVDDATARTLPLRRPPAVTGRIRIVEIDGFDYSACGGTHVRSTAEIAPLKVVRQERRRHQTRITFVCGLRAGRDYRVRSRLLAETAALFSTEAAVVPELVRRLQAQVRELAASNAQLLEQALAQEAAMLAAAAPRERDVAIVVYHTAERTPDALKQLAAHLRELPQVVALLVATTQDKSTVIFCRSDDIPLHAGDLLRDALAAFGGRGGGRPEHAQGGGIAPGAAPALLAYAQNLARQRL